MTDIVQLLSRGLGAGSVYALLALGFVIIYKATRVISFAQPAFVLTGAVLVSYLAAPLGFAAAVLVAAAATAGLALLVERIAIRPMLGRPVFTVAMITLGVDTVVRVLAGALLGIELRQVGDPWGLRTVSVFGVAVQQRHLAMIAVTAVLVSALFAFFRFTRTGLAMRAVAIDQEVALVQGVSVGAVFALSWAIAGALAAVGGAFAAAGGTVDPNLWLIALIALPVIILGGLDSLPGAVLGGLLIGVLQEVVADLRLGADLAALAPYAVMLAVLVVRPYGLFGTREVERV